MSLHLWRSQRHGGRSLAKCFHVPSWQVSLLCACGACNDKSALIGCIGHDQNGHLVYYWGMKIGMLTDVYKPILNGITNSIDLCQQEMQARGHEVSVFTFGAPEPSDRAAGIIRSPALPISDTGYHLGLRYSREAKEALQQMDILHAHHPFVSGRLAARYGRQFGQPVVFTNHTRYDLYAQFYLSLVPPPLTQLALETFLPTFTALCDLVIAPSQSIKQVLQDMGIRDEIVVVPNGIRLDRVYNPPPAVSRSELDIPDEAVVIVFCGRLAPEKNVDFLLEAFDAAAVAVPAAHLLLVGSGPDEPDIRAQTRHQPRVHVVGQVGYDEVPAYLALADLFATASVSEVHPLSLIEALAAGLPVLAIDSPGIRDTVRPQKDGFLSLEHLAEFTALMVRLLIDRDLREQMATSARQHSHEFDISATVDHLLELYAALLSRPQNGRRRPADDGELLRQLQPLADD